MKPRRKFNRGVIIAIIVVLCISIYLITLSITENAEKPAIQKVVESYLKTYVSYNMLPQSYRTATPNIPKDQMDSYVAKMKSAIKSYFASNDNSYKFMTDMLKSSLESQKDESTVIFDYSKSVSKYTSFNFDKSTVTVTLETNSNYDGPDINDTASGRQKLNAVTTDTIVLKKVGSDWKVVYSDIKRPSQRTSLGGGFRIKRKLVGGD